MRAVWSFWSKPFRAHHRHVWLSGTHHLLAWVLSVETAKRHYPTTLLVTDDAGAELLVGRLGLEFTAVSTELETLRDADPEWWALGKLWTYRSQHEPFVHLDTDVFAWKRIPRHVEGAGVFGQNPERFPIGDESWYRPTLVTEAIRSVDGWAPEEFWSAAAAGFDQAVCCGVFGGTDTSFISHYADLAIRMIEHPRNQRAWATLGGVIGHNILLEQYLLAACVRFHRNRALSAYRDIDLAYLFDSEHEAFDESIAADVGYTHLIGAAKSNPSLLERLSARVERDHPAHYARCIEHGEAWS